MRYYLDYNASAPMTEEVKNYIVKVLGQAGNPSSVHGTGRNSKKLLENSRKNISNLINCNSENVIFTSGATEANNLALNGYDKKIISSIEHESIINQENTFPIKVNKQGYVDLNVLENVVKDQKNKNKLIISVMFANNETGIIQPIEKIKEISDYYNIPFHSDGVQAIGRIKIDFLKLGIDMLTVSSHKLGGPNGAGALIVSSKSKILKPLFLGGHQEDSLRSGTEPLLSIAGFGEAANLIDINKMVKLKELRKQYEKKLKSLNLGIQIIGENSNRLPNTFMIYVPNINAENLLIALDMEGFEVSTGSACSSGKAEPSKVVINMGYSMSIASSVIRISLGLYNNVQEVEKFVDALIKIINRFKDLKL